MTTIPELNVRLQELHTLTSETPLFNPVFELSLDLSRKIENGAMSLASVQRNGIRAGM